MADTGAIAITNGDIHYGLVSIEGGTRRTCGQKTNLRGPKAVPITEAAFLFRWSK
jgi:hypothetical protein